MTLSESVANFDSSEAPPPPLVDDDLPEDVEPSPEETINVEYVRPFLYKKQLDAIFDERRFSAIEATTKGGKTVGAIAWLVEQAMIGPGNGANYWWVAPVTGQADIAFTRISRFLPKGTYASYNKPARVILVNGAIIWFKGADRSDTLYGDDVHAAVLDEASRMKEASWHAVRSTLTFTRGRCRFIGNVRGRKNWFYQLCRRAERGEDPTLAFHRITAFDAIDAGVLAKEEIDAARRELPESVFNELYLAQASDDGENPFGMLAIAARVGPMSPGPVAAWGWDLAKKRDYTVGIGLDAYARVCKAVRFRVDWGSTTERIIRLSGNTPALVDSTGVGDPILESLQKAPGSKFEGYTFSSPSKQKLMEGLAAAIQTPTQIMYPASVPPHEDSPLDVPIQFELEQFEYEFTRTGVRYSAPSGFNDDVVCALSLARHHLTMAPMPIRISGRVLERSRRPF